MDDPTDLEKIIRTGPSIMDENLEGSQQKPEIKFTEVPISQNDQSNSSESPNEILQNNFGDFMESTLKQDADNTEDPLENGTSATHEEAHDNSSSSNHQNRENETSESSVSSNIMKPKVKTGENYMPDSVNIMTNQFDKDKTELGEIKHNTNGPNPNFQKKAEESNYSSQEGNHQNVSGAIVDTAAPFKSVREAVTKFGGIVDWKAHKAQALERRKNVQIQLQEVQEEILKIQEQFEAAEEAKSQVLKELNDTKRHIEELKLNLERAQTVEAQAKQDSELAQLRAREIEQGIDVEASVAAKTQLEVAKARYSAAVADLKSTKEELESLRKEYDCLVGQKDAAIEKAEEAVFACQEMEKTVEDLTLELITTKELLESAHATHLEAEEHRIGAALAREQDVLNWEKELKQAEEEVKSLNEQLLLSKDVKSKLDSASTLLLNLKGELAAYMEAKLNQEAMSNEKASASKEEIDEVKETIKKAKEEVSFLKVASESLKLELEKEQLELNSMRQREGMASIAVSSLEAEVNRVLEEIEQTRAKESESREKMIVLPKLIQEAAKQADQAKSARKLAMEEERKAKEDSEQTKASASLIEIRLNAALKEIEATRASEKLALAAIKALEESEQTTAVNLPFDEYYNLSKQAHEAEEMANERVTIYLAHIQVAMESEKRSIQRLEETNKKMAEKKEILKMAMEKSEKAKEGKLGVEQDLRKWRAEHEKLRRASNSAINAIPTSFEDSSREEKSSGKDEPSPELYVHGNNTEHVLVEKKLRKKNSLLPRLVTFLARKKSQPIK